jgi:hypothetical protein
MFPSICGLVGNCWCQIRQSGIVNCWQFQAHLDRLRESRSPLEFLLETREASRGKADFSRLPAALVTPT